jgi:Arc/MetJ-type ribon-helix-helix transcriptional regulator
MPASLRKEVETYVEEGQYASISEFFRDMVRTWRRNALLRGLKESQKEFKAGKAKKLTSFKNLR